MSRALILSGGGARAAYQVGVLKALRDILPDTLYAPFPIICGTSAGAINTLALAGRPGNFASQVTELENVWRQLCAERIYRTDTLGVFKNTLRLLSTLVHGRSGMRWPTALLDNSPLRELLDGYIQFRAIDEAIASRRLEAVAVTAMSYSTGQSITFFQGQQDNWKRARRMGLRTGLTLDHLMASAAIPTIFPPTKIGDHYYGDGALRQLKPLSSALHLGARRLFVVGVSDNPARTTFEEQVYHPPSLAQMIGHMLNSAFIDSIESDLETLRAINRLTAALTPAQRVAHGIEDLQAVDFLCITPSQGINTLAEEYLHELPGTVKTFLRLTGASAKGGGTSAASYLLFEQGFIGRLIDLGHADTLRQESRIVDFFSAENTGDDQQRRYGAY
ncbi:MAG: patatin-like phospholipase family protein [Porticoccaceae bacterium]|jgi:NTE family protein